MGYFTYKMRRSIEIRPKTCCSEGYSLVLHIAQFILLSLRDRREVDFKDGLKFKPGARFSLMLMLGMVWSKV